jgi:hypothetical protein
MTCRFNLPCISLLISEQQLPISTAHKVYTLTFPVQAQPVIVHHPQYYAIATGAIFFYDYLLTLGDEVRKMVSPGALSFASETTCR